jgi:hypothetical protein
VQNGSCLIVDFAELKYAKSLAGREIRRFSRLIPQRTLDVRIECGLITKSINVVC